jgi:hypothetical protein
MEAKMRKKISGLEQLIVFFLMLYSFNINADDLRVIHTITLNKKAPQKLISIAFQDLDHSDPSLKIGDVYYEKFDLNGDNLKEYFLYVAKSGWCGSHGCSIKIISKQSSKIKLLLEVTSYSKIYILHHKTNGYHDFSFYPKTEINRYIWHWNGTKYE